MNYAITDLAKYFAAEKDLIVGFGNGCFGVPEWTMASIYSVKEVASQPWLFAMTASVANLDMQLQLIYAAFAGCRWIFPCAYSPVSAFQSPLNRQTLLLKTNVIAACAAAKVNVAMTNDQLSFYAAGGPALTENYTMPGLVFLLFGLFDPTEISSLIDVGGINLAGGQFLAFVQANATPLLMSITPNKLPLLVHTNNNDNVCAYLFTRTTLNGWFLCVINLGDTAFPQYDISFAWPTAVQNTPTTCRQFYVAGPSALQNTMLSFSAPSASQNLNLAITILAANTQIFYMQ